MKRKNDEHLYTNFPLLYRLKDDPSAPISVGFGCGDGWFALLKELSEKLESIISVMDRPVERRPAVYQVAERDGYLVFEMTGGNKDIRDLVHEAQMRSAQICEICGSPGEVRSDGMWLRALCGRCHQWERERLDWRFLELPEPPEWMDPEYAFRVTMILRNLGEDWAMARHHAVHDAAKGCARSHPLYRSEDVLFRSIDLTSSDEDAYRRILQSRYVLEVREVGRDAALELVAFARRALETGRTLERLLRRAVRACWRGDVDLAERSLNEAYRLEMKATGRYEFTWYVTNCLDAYHDEEGWHIPRCHGHESTAPERGQGGEEHG